MLRQSTDVFICQLNILVDKLLGFLISPEILSPDHFIPDASPAEMALFKIIKAWVT